MFLSEPAVVSLFHCDDDTKYAEAHLSTRPIACSSNECFKTGSKRCTVLQVVNVNPALPRQL